MKSIADYLEYLRCDHDECAYAYASEIDRIGFERAEPLCVVAERAEDARTFGLEALEEDYWRR